MRVVEDSAMPPFCCFSTLVNFENLLDFATLNVNGAAALQRPRQFRLCGSKSSLRGRKFQFTWIEIPYVDVNQIDVEENPKMNDRFKGLDEFDRLLNAAERSAAEQNFANEAKDTPEFQHVTDTAWELIHRNDIDTLSHALELNGSVAHLLKLWSEDDALADEFDGLLNVRMIIVANTAKREIGGK